VQFETKTAPIPRRCRRVARLVSIRPALAVAIGLSCVLIGCGGDSQEDSSSPEDDAQAAVAEFLTALADQNAADACASLTASAREDLVATFNKLDKPQPSWTRCEDPLQELLDGAGPDERRKATTFAEHVRSGHLPNGSVTVAIATDRGTVTIAAGETLLPVSVELVDREWLITTPGMLLFGEAES
jgi:hypothetical protein